MSVYRGLNTPPIRKLFEIRVTNSAQSPLVQLCGYTKHKSYFCSYKQVLCIKSETQQMTSVISWFIYLILYLWIVTSLTFSLLLFRAITKQLLMKDIVHLSKHTTLLKHQDEASEFAKAMGVKRRKPLARSHAQILPVSSCHESFASS